MEQITKEIHKPAIKNFERRKVLTLGIDDIWAIDLLDMSEYKEFNGLTKILCLRPGHGSCSGATYGSAPDGRLQAPPAARRRYPPGLRPGSLQPSILIGFVGPFLGQLVLWDDLVVP